MARQLRHEAGRKMVRLWPVINYTRVFIPVLLFFKRGHLLAH